MVMRLYIDKPNAIFTGRVNQATFTYPLQEVTFDGVTLGAYGDIVPGMTILFGSTAGDDDLGRQRIRKAATSTVIYIGRSSQGIRDGEVNLTDNAYITIYNDYRVWAKIPYIDEDGNIYKDGDLTVGTDTTTIPPKANITPAAYAATIDSGTSLITVALSGTTSTSVSGATISAYLWDVDDGAITVGTSASSAITATFPAGFRYVSLTVTDSNTKTHTMRIPVLARNPAADTTVSGFNITSHVITPAGQTLEVQVISSISDKPDGSLVMLWDGEPASSSDYTHMKFTGWHHYDPANTAAQMEGTTGNVTLQCLDTAGKLATLPGFPQAIESAASPAIWTEMSSPNMDKYLDYLLRWHSTALEVAVWTPSGTGSSFPFVVLGSDGESLFDQVEGRARALVPDYHLTCDRYGRLAVKVDPILQETADRTATVQTTIDESEWSSISYTATRPPRVHWHRGNAIRASATEISALFCIAPGESPGQGEMDQEQGEQLAQSQDDLNACEGNRYARVNAFNSYLSIVLAGGDDFDIEPAALTWVSLTMSADTAAQRGLTFSAARGLAQEINISYEGGPLGLTKTITITWEQETSGTPAVTYIPPVGPPDDPWDPPDPPPYPGPTPGGGFGTAYFAVDAYLAQTKDLSATSPAWTNITPAGATAVYDFILDPWSPGDTGYVSTEDGLYKSTNLDQVTPTWSLVLSPAQAESGTSRASFATPYKVMGSINQHNYVVLFFIVETNKLYCAYSEDGGSTWTFSSQIGDNLRNSTAWMGAAEVVPHTIGGSLRLFAAAHYSGGNQRIYKSDNKGRTWALWIGSPPLADPDSNDTPGISLSAPYDDNLAGNILYATFYRAAGGVGYGWYTTDGSTATATTYGATLAKRTGLGTHTHNRQHVSHWTQGSILYVSLNGGQTWGQRSATGISGSVMSAGGFPYNDQQYYVLTSVGIYTSIDGGNTFTSKSGDWALGFTTSLGRGVVVPNWTE